MRKHTAAEAMADTRSAIIKILRTQRKKAKMAETVEFLDIVEAKIRQMDERALTRKGGVVRPNRPLRKIPGTGIKKVVKA